MNRYDAVVVGGGPSGCVAALSLARAGRQVLVLEAKPEAARRRLAGEWLHPAGFDVLRDLGVAPPLAERASDTGATRGRGFVVHTDDLGAPIVLPYADDAVGCSWDHHRFVSHLRAHVEDDPNIELRSHARVDSVEDGRVRFQLEGQHMELSTPLIVGADGRSSVTRKSLGYGAEQVLVSRTAGLTLRGATLSHEQYGHLAIGGPGPMMIYRLDGDTIRVCVDVPLWFDTGATPDPRALWEAYGAHVPAELRDAFHAALIDGPIQWAANQVRLREHYGTTGVRLAGDSIGHFHPMTALGMTLGFLDAQTAAERSFREFTRIRRRESQTPAILAVALYDMMAGTSPSARDMRRALYDVWRRDPDEREQTMRYLAAQDTDRPRFISSWLRVVLAGVRDGMWGRWRSSDRDAVRRPISYIAERIPWLLHSMSAGRPVDVRMTTTAAPPSAKPARRHDTESSTAPVALERGLAALIARQAEAGDWEGEVFWNAMLSCQYAMMLRVIDRPIDEGRRARVLRQLEHTQLPDGTWGMHDGSWKLHGESEAYLFHTTLCYVAARLLGVAADDPLLARAGAFIHACGGARSIPSWGKFWLSLLGLYDWRGVNPILPETWSLPRALPLHPSRLYCHTRLIYMAMSSLYGRKFIGPVDDLIFTLRGELYPEGWQPASLARARHVVRDEDVYLAPTARVKRLFDLSAAYDRVHLRGRRAKALETMRARIRYELDTTDHSCVSPVSGMLNVVALHAADPLDPQIDAAIAGLEAWIWEDEDKGLRVAGARSATWDTAFALQALAQASEVELETPTRARVDDARARAESFLTHQQMRAPLPHFRAHDRADSTGGFCFGHRQHGWPVSDCTAEAVLGLGDKLPLAQLREALNFVLRAQNHDGGFGTYESRRARVDLSWMNPAEMYGPSTTEMSMVECTASCLAALGDGRTRLPTDDPLRAIIHKALTRGGRWIRRAQAEDGAWAGNWGVSSIYGTMFGIRGLLAAGTRDHDPALRAAQTWFLARQRPDGGWGESVRSTLEGDYIPHRDMQVVQTAWALLALSESRCPNWGAVDAAAEALGRAQNGDGTWPQQDPAGVFFQTALLDYEMYRAYFPVWALAAHESRRRRASSLSASCDN